MVSRLVRVFSGEPSQDGEILKMMDLLYNFYKKITMIIIYDVEDLVLFGDCLYFDLQLGSLYRAQHGPSSLFRV